METDRLPPHNADAEDSILGAMLTERVAADIAVADMRPSDFYQPRAKVLFQMFSEMYEKDPELDITLVQAEADRRGISERYPGNSVGNYLEHVPDPANVEKYCRLVREAAVRRALLEFGNKLQERVFSDELKEVCTFAESQCAEITAKRDGQYSEPVSLHDLARVIADDALNNEPRTTYGLPFGFCGRCLDDLTGGCIPETYWVLAGRTSMGKTTLINSIALSFAQTNPDEGKPLILTTEMSEQAISYQALGARAGVHTKGLLYRNLTADQRSSVLDVIRTRELEGVYVQNMAGKTVGGVRAVAKRHKAKHGLPLMIIDLASKLKASGKERREILTNVSQGLHELKTELKTCIIATVQINRSVFMNTPAITLSCSAVSITVRESGVT